MAVTSFSSLIAYFQNLASSHVDINDFVHGPSRRILEKNRSSLNYPVLWLETPGVDFWDNGANWMDGTRSSAFLILKHADPNDFDAQDTVYAETEEMALQVLAKMIKDHKAKTFRFDLNSCSMRAVSTLHVNTEFGWRVEFDLENTVKICYDQTKWN